LSKVERHMTSKTAESRYVVAVGPSACGKTKALDALIGENAIKYAKRVGYQDGLRQNHVDAFLRKKRSTVLTVEALLDVDARDTFAELITRVAHQKCDGKSVHHETRSFFEVPLALRPHINAVVMFRSASEDERRRVYRYFAQSIFADREQFDEALDALVGYDCLLMEKGENAVCIYNAKEGRRATIVATTAARPSTIAAAAASSSPSAAAASDAVQVSIAVQNQQEKKGEKPMGYRRWFWSMLGY
jgi:hypothetical protein